MGQFDRTRVDRKLFGLCGAGHQTVAKLSSTLECGSDPLRSLMWRRLIRPVASRWFHHRVPNFPEAVRKMPITSTRTCTSTWTLTWSARARGRLLPCSRMGTHNPGAPNEQHSEARSSIKDTQMSKLQATGLMTCATDPILSRLLRPCRLFGLHGPGDPGTAILAHTADGPRSRFSPRRRPSVTARAEKSSRASNPGI